MIKFFRKIRQKMLTENKFSKYLIYAIGEIALVMIGILLALQVNNWNEARIEKNLTDDIILNYIKDLRNNAVYLERRKLAMEKDLKFINQITERLNSSVLLSDTLKKIALYEFSPIYYAFTELKNDTYISLVSNNQLRLVPDNLSTQMINISFRMNDLTKTQESVGEFYRHNLSEYSFQYPMPMDNSLYSNKENELLWESFDKNKLMLAFQGIVFTKKAGYTSLLPRADSLLVKIDAVIADIESSFPHTIN